MALMRRVLVGNRRACRRRRGCRRRRLVHGTLDPADALHVTEENQRGGENALATAERAHDGKLTPGDALDPSRDER